MTPNLLEVDEYAVDELQAIPLAFAEQSAVGLSTQGEGSVLRAPEQNCGGVNASAVESCEQERSFPLSQLRDDGSDFSAFQFNCREAFCRLE